MRWLVIAVLALVALIGTAFAFAGPGGEGTSAYALVDPNGGLPVLVSAHTRGFVNVSSPFTGDYCLTPGPGVNVTDTAAVASMEAFYSNAVGVVAVRYQPGVNCGADQLEVKTWIGTGEDVTPTDEIAFTVSVP
jgi:hypothetical protein